MKKSTTAIADQISDIRYMPYTRTRNIRDWHSLLYEYDTTTIDLNNVYDDERFKCISSELVGNASQVAN